jgi:hypothetical protein
MPKKYYCVLDNVRGYLPDSENSYYDNLADAQADALERVRDYRERDYIVRGSLKARFWECEQRDGGPYSIGSVIEINEIDKELYLQEVDYLS